MRRSSTFAPAARVRFEPPGHPAVLALSKRDGRHPSLHLRKVGRFWSARVGAHHRVLAVQEGEDLVWFWIGGHDEYDRLIGPRG